MLQVTMLPIEPFKADFERLKQSEEDGKVTFEFASCRVVGISYSEEDQERWVVIKTDPDDGHLYPDTIDCIWPPQ